MMQEPERQQAHPRRPPAHLSVSLRHESPSPASSGCSRRAQAARDEERHRLDRAWKRSPICQTSEESNESADSGVAPAQKWFDRSNKNVGEKWGQGFDDNEPPYFIPNPNGNSSNPTADVEGAPPLVTASNQDGYPSFPDFMHTVTIGSSVDDFRSVIDDLTIENKKLKEKLRRYESSHSSGLEKDKLFEVKIHGLSPRKKRELEATLHAFASSISKGESTDSSTSCHLGDGRRPNPSLRAVSQKPSSSSTSNSRLIDSAYASLSTSGPISSSASNHMGMKRKGSEVPNKSKMIKVQSFLDDIPQGLLPKHSTVMSERGRKKLVVRRLEQLFTGKIREYGGKHSQPLQQQEVSQSAAQADRQAIENRGQQVSAEGVREAHILSKQSGSDKAQMPLLAQEGGGSSYATNQAEGNDKGMDKSASPDQRPTRPLDLDPDRAQVPADNIEYIRHLGLSTPIMAAGDGPEMTSEDDYGWVYLNLLVNMAQLHIHNVTPDFVRSAVAEISTKFELSQDGQKIRWRGGTEGTELSSDTDNANRTTPSGSDSPDISSNKRPRMNADTDLISPDGQPSSQGRFAPVSMATQVSGPSNLTNARPGIQQYKSLFRHDQSSDDVEMSPDDSVVSFIPGRESSEITGSRRKSQGESLSKRKRHNGALVFYSGAPFCTDLSGDHESIATPLHVTGVNVDGFSNHSNDALGCRTKTLRPAPSRTPSGSTLPFRPFKDYSVFAGPFMRHETRSRTPELVTSEDDMNFDFSPQWATNSVQQESRLLRLEACGLGGTQPADHFSVSIQTSRPKLNSRTTRISKFSAPGPRAQKFYHRISTEALASFRSSSPEEVLIARLSAMRAGSPASLQPPTPPTPVESLLKTTILSTRVQNHQPSELPPPATYHGAFSSSTEYTDETSSDENVAYPRRAPIFARRDFSPASVDGAVRNTVSMDVDESSEPSSEAEADDDSDSSIDLLAHAREIDPEMVRAREQEYERQAAQEFAEVESGTTAATANSVSAELTSSSGGSESGDSDDS